MILSSCGCKVSWVLRTAPPLSLCDISPTCGGIFPLGMRLLRSLPGLRVLSTQQARCVRQPCFCKQSCRPRFRKIHRILPNHPSPNLRIFRWGRWCDTRVQLCAGNAINAENCSFMRRGSQMIFTSAGLPADWRSGSSSRMYPCPQAVPASEKSPPFSLKNFPDTSEKAQNA